MRRPRHERIEAAVDHAAAAIFGAAVLGSAFVLLAGTFAEPLLGVLAAGLAVTAFAFAAGILRRIQPAAPKFEIRAFRITDLELDEPEELFLTEQVELLLTEQVELVLTEADRLHPRRPAQAQELFLDDIMAELGPGSRVVRLFDPAAMPTPGQLDDRIQQHLRDGNSPTAPPDASQALYEALAKLRGSLR